MTNAPSFRVQPGDPQYMADAVAEGVFWDKPRFFSTEAYARGEFDEYSNHRFTDNPALRWFETLHLYGRFGRGLFFGCSAISQEARILELNYGLSCKFMDISGASLERRIQELGPRFAGRVEIEQADLNFAELAPSAYDVIVSSGMLHHLINIEHAAYQINRGPRAGGYFFLQDYVMEDRLQFSSQRTAIFEAVVGRGKARGDLPRSTHAVWPAVDDSSLSPFEAIRSKDTVAVLDATLNRIEVRGAGALNALLIFLSLNEEDARRYDNMGQHLRHRRPHSFRRRISVALGRSHRPAMSNASRTNLLLLDKVCIDSGC